MTFIKEIIVFKSWEVFSLKEIRENISVNIQNDGFLHLNPLLILRLLLILLRTISELTVYNHKLLLDVLLKKDLCISTRFPEMSDSFSLCCELRSFILVSSSQQPSQQ